MAISSIKVRIQDLLGSDMNASLVPSYADLVANGFNSIADLIPVTSELWSRSTLNSSTDSTLDMSDRRIIMVTRTASGDVERLCREISYHDYLKGQADGSIFYVVKGSRIPAYTIQPDGAWVVAPAPAAGESVRVYYFHYITADISDSLLLGPEAEGSGGGFPREAEPAGCLAAALNLLQARISFSVQDDEDGELVQLLQAQNAVLSQNLQGQARRLGFPYKIIGEE